MSRLTGKRIPLALAFAALLMLAPAVGLVATTRNGEAQHQHTSADSLHDTMRSLWEDHVVWTRLYILSAIADSPDKDATTQRLLQNQDDIGNAIAPYYGEGAGAQLAELLREHILGAAALLDAAQSGDQTAVDTASAAWYANADEIAAFLNALNPDQWPVDALKSQMKMHLDMTLAEVTDHLNGDYAADVADFDRIRTHILNLADLLSQGIEAQFPDQFA